MLDSFEQLELFPSATRSEVDQTKELLEEYEQCLLLRDTFEEDLQDLDESELESYKECVRKIKKIKRAAKSILDPTIREIIDYRYIQCNTYTSTVYHFASKMDDRTVERKMIKGIETIAEILKIY